MKGGFQRGRRLYWLLSKVGRVLEVYYRRPCPGLAGWSIRGRLKHSAESGKLWLLIFFRFKIGSLIDMLLGLALKPRLSSMSFRCHSSGLGADALDWYWRAFEIRGEVVEG